MSVIRIDSLTHPGVEVFGSLTDAQSRIASEGAGGFFIAESPKVITAALDAGITPISLLCEERHITGDAAPIIARCPGIPVYTGPRELLTALTGYRLTRGVLCAMQRPAPKAAADVCRDAARVAVIDGVCDTTNIGAIFRSAAALGFQAVLLTPGTCDPLNRRAVRVSMGTVFKVPWTWIPSAVEPLRQLGFPTVAMALRHDALELGDPRLSSLDRVALIFGTEGDGLAADVIRDADLVCRIPMSLGVDSLNVAAASAVAFWEFRHCGTHR